MTRHTATPITLNPEQQLAVEALSAYIEDPDPENWCFTFYGPAGTGKTFCMREVVARSRKSHSNFVFTAPTNKAAKVLRSITGEACTIYSLLGLRVDKSGELKQVLRGQKPDLSEIDVIFVDEASMVNRNLLAILRSECEILGVKVVFMGDAAQLPPVGEPNSPVWGEAPGASLSKVMRHDNQILKLCSAIRGVMGSIAPSITITSDHDSDSGVWKLTKASFKEAIYNAACRGDFADGSKSKVISWRNIRVGEYNDLIRLAIFGTAAIPGSYLTGERIVATGPCMRGDTQLLSTDDEAIVESVVECAHPLEPKYRALELLCRTEEDRQVRLLVLHPESQQRFEADSQQKAHEAKANGKLWKQFWDHQELFHQVKYAYAITAHRAQGSTYEEVYVDYQDILYNRDRAEAFRCLYVACSRPTTKLFLA